MSEYRCSTQAEETSWSSLPVIVLCCIYNFDKCVADQQVLKGGQHPVDPDLNIDLTYKSRTKSSVIGPFLSRHVSFSRPNFSAVPIQEQLPVYNTRFLINRSAVTSIWAEFVLSMTLLYMLGCLLFSNQMEKLQLNCHYISETICQNERRKCASAIGQTFFPVQLKVY